MSNNIQFACKTHDVKPGEPAIVQVNNLPIGIFQIAEDYYAMLNVCPHLGAPVCEGPVSGTTEGCCSGKREFNYVKENELVRCAWHGWEFDIKTGEFLVDPSIKARTYLTSIEGDSVMVHL